jgi:bacteriocin-like protein
MKKRNFKELKKEELKNIKGGDKLENGSDEFDVIMSLRTDAKSSEKKD